MKEIGEKIMEERTKPSGIKVLCIGLARRGGMLHFHDCLVEGLSSQCTVASLTAAAAEHSDRVAQQTNVRHFFVDTGKGAIGTLSKLLAPDSWRALERTIEVFSPDVAHVTGAQEWNPFLGAILKKRNIPTVYTVHDVIHHEGVPGYFRVTEAIFRKLPSGFVVLTGESKRQLAAQGVDETKIRVIPHGVYDFFRRTQSDEPDSQGTNGTDAPTDDPKPKTILFFGRIEPVVDPNHARFDVGVGALRAQRILHQHAGGLSQDLAEDDARNDGIIGKMTLQEKLVTADGVVPDSDAVLMSRIVKQQHVVSVRQYAHQFFSVHILTVSYGIALCHIPQPGRW